jgi:hypothetical protein
MTIFGLFWVPGRGQKMNFSKIRQKPLIYIPRGPKNCRHEEKLGFLRKYLTTLPPRALKSNYG